MGGNVKSKKTAMFKGYKPLVHTEAGLVLYNKGTLWLYADQKIQLFMRLRGSNWKDGSRLFVRLFRREPKTAVAVQKKILLCWNRKIDYIDAETKRCTTVFSVREGFSDVLNICPVENDEYIAFWGDYGSNAQREAVYIYGMKVDGKVDILHTFSAGTIRHVHNIIPKKTGGFYILTGDTEETAGIYTADELFRNVEPVALDKQQYRVVVAFDTEQGLLYATDAVNEPNHIYLLTGDGACREIAGINGSCIYGTKYGADYLFSTTVEPDENNRGIFSWLSYRRGKGILSDEVHLISVTEQLEVSLLVDFRKDLLPMKLFQYGSIQFPQGESDSLWIYPVAVRQSDGTAMMIEGSEGR